jgi:hypothetical protein
LHAVTSLGDVEGIFDEYLENRERFAACDEMGAGAAEVLEPAEA